MLEQELTKAIEEIGTIKPTWDADVQAFVFEHPAYPVRYAGATESEVIQNYPLYLKDFIEERLNGNLAPEVEKMTSGRGGVRPGAGRKKGSTTAEESKTIRLPKDLADWLKADEANIEAARKLMG